MKTVTSKDGTQIAFDKLGKGKPLILVDGALGFRKPQENGLETYLAKQFEVYVYDRRGRNDSTDTAPYAIQREIEDIHALINIAGGSAFLYGMSSGAILALRAANALTSKVSKLALYEPPFILDDSRPPLPDDYVEQLDAAIAGGDRNKAVEIFMLQAILLPQEYLEPMQASPMWQDMESVAHTLAYDGLIVRDYMTGQPWDGNPWSDITAPTLAIVGEHSDAFFHNGAQALIHDVTTARYSILEGQMHNVDAAVLAPVLIDFFNS